MSYDCNDVNFPTTLKQTLDFLSRLKDLNAASKLANELKTKTGVMLFKEGGLTQDIVTNIQQLLVNAHELRTKIVSTQEAKQYGDYINLNDPNNRDCIERYVNIFIGILPKLHGTLYYLYFHVNVALSDQGGGSWYSYMCNQKEKSLCEWLIKNKETPSSRMSNANLFPGGYNGIVLSANQGTALFEPLQQLVRSDIPGGFLQNVLMYILIDYFRFSNDTASALAFLAAFCSAVTSKTFDNQEYYNKLGLKLKSVCESLSELLSAFTSDDKKNSTYLVALYRGSVTHYKKLLDPHHFASYVSWLKKNIIVLVGYLTNLSTECKAWNSSSIKNSTYAGPFPYGFMFGSRWSRDDRWSSARQETSVAIDTVIVALHKLSECLKESGKANSTKAATGTASAVATSRQVSGEVRNTNQQVSHVSNASNQQHSQQGDYSMTESSGSSTSQSPETEDGSARTPISSPPESHRSGTVGGSGTDTSGVHPTEPSSEGVTSPQVRAEVTVGKSFTSAPKVTAKTGGSHGRSEDIRSHHTHSGEQEKRSQAETLYEGGNSTITIGGAAGGAALLGGGGAALYFLNVGGIKTLITGVP